MYRLLILFIIPLIFIGCNSDDDPAPTPPQNEEEVITTVILNFVEKGGTGTATFSFRDLDGDGGNAPVVTPIVLDTNKVYELSIELFDESDPMDVDTITNEILDEDDEHLFCFTPTGADVTITRTDSDGTFEVGLESDWACGAASTGTVKIVLKHQPGVKDGNCGPGDTDIEIDWSTTIQ